MEYRRSNPIPPESHSGYPPTPHDQYRSFTSLVSGCVNVDQSLETALSRLNLSSPSRQSQFRPAMSGLADSTAAGGGGSMIGNNSYMGSSIGARFPHLSYQQEEKTLMDLQRLRIESAVKGQMGLFMPNNGCPILANQSFRGLGLPRMNSNGGAFTDYQFTDLQDGHCPEFSNVVGFQGRSQLTQESSYGYLNRPYSSRYAFEFHSDFQGRGKSIDGLELKNSNYLMSSSMKNHKRRNYSSLEELRGRILMVVKEQYGCRFLQSKVEEGKTEDVEIVFSELEDHILELMVDQSVNFLIQKLLAACNEEQINKVFLKVISDEHRLLAICLDMHGTRCMQKLLENLTNQKQRSLIVSILWPHTIMLSKNINGHHVIQHCLKYFSYEDNKLVLDEVADDCLNIATNKSGCCVLQHSLARAQGEHRERLVADIKENALVLSEHPYGNYVVQYILGMRIPHFTADILAELFGRFVPLSLNKFGSNVVERCLNESSEEQTTQIIREIIESPNFLMVLQDHYGNYVAQSALLTSKGATRSALVHRIQFHYPLLHSHPHGKRVLARSRGSKRHV